MGDISSNQIKQYNIERSKFFSYPTDGEEIEVSFLLFNTVERDIWRKHYRFILGFTLRNLPFMICEISFSNRDKSLSICVGLFE